jgi:hypothetical protein
MGCGGAMLRASTVRIRQSTTGSCAGAVSIGAAVLLVESFDIREAFMVCLISRN